VSAILERERETERERERERETEREAHVSKKLCGYRMTTDSSSACSRRPEFTEKYV
jgi:hypothetical protein